MPFSLKLPHPGDHVRYYDYHCETRAITVNQPKTPPTFLYGLTISWFVLPNHLLLFCYFLVYQLHVSVCMYVYSISPSG